MDAVNIKAVLVQMMVGSRKRNKSLSPEPMMTQFTDAYMRY